MRRRAWLCLLGVALLVGSRAFSAQTGELLIAAASDLQTVFPHLVTGFERETGIKPTVTFGSSGNFFAQIQNGAPYDPIFLLMSTTRDAWARVGTPMRARCTSTQSAVSCCGRARTAASTSRAG